MMVVPLIPFGGPMLRNPDFLSTGSLLLQAVFIVAFTYLLWFWLVRRYPASGLTPFAFLSPVHGVILGGLLLNEPLSVNIFIALGLIAAGLLLVNRPADASSRVRVWISCVNFFNDLEAGSFVSHENPMERARAQNCASRSPNASTRRVEVTEADGGFPVLLDGKPVRTPGRAYLALPTAAAAQLVADEFDAQGEILDIPAMPVLRLANTALDGVAQDTQAVLEDILRYASCDLVCYRADGPEPLVARQAEWLGCGHRLGPASLSARDGAGRRRDACRPAARGHRRHRHSPQCPQRPVPSCRAARDDLAHRLGPAGAGGRYGRNSRR